MPLLGSSEASNQRRLVPRTEAKMERRMDQDFSKPLLQEVLQAAGSEEGPRLKTCDDLVYIQTRWRALWSTSPFLLHVLRSKFKRRGDGVTLQPTKPGNPLMLLKKTYLVLRLDRRTNQLSTVFS
ncbi:hypothetical protein CRENBAI_009444 [Crenichthys baileyi]|uniref:Uncharacterized protein n=1 Tax=Crenichthys baileyi TaxID=28760 RepID=A0AAV9SEE3_9TELE